MVEQRVIDLLRAMDADMDNKPSDVAQAVALQVIAKMLGFLVIGIEHLRVEVQRK